MSPGVAPASVLAAEALDHAAELIKARAYSQALGTLRALLAADPGNRRARELLAFALESKGDLGEERKARSALARDFPFDSHVQYDYGRVLERSGDESGALRAYQRARELSGGAPNPELDAAIERIKGRTAVEVETPVTVMSDPDARASRVRAGAAIPIDARQHLTVLGTRCAAQGTSGPNATTSLALGLAWTRSLPGMSWTLGSGLSAITPQLGTRTDLAAGGSVAGRARLPAGFEAAGAAELESPWDEAAVTVLHGGRASYAEGHVYSSWLSQRLLLQAGARRRRLSILETPEASARAFASQSLWLAGADAVLWRSGAALRGEMLDERLIAPATVGSAVTLAYRHYDVTSWSTPDFATAIALAPRAQVDEASARAALASPRASLGFETDAGLGYDSARHARQWRAGGAVTWAPLPTARIALGYEEATENVTGLFGRRRETWLSVHADL